MSANVGDGRRSDRLRLAATRPQSMPQKTADFYAHKFRVKST
jgi:hypothetical protein